MTAAGDKRGQANPRRRSAVIVRQRPHYGRGRAKPTPQQRATAHPPPQCLYPPRSSPRESRPTRHAHRMPCHGCCLRRRPQSAFYRLHLTRAATAGKLARRPPQRPGTQAGQAEYPASQAPLGALELSQPRWRRGQGHRGAGPRRRQPHGPRPQATGAALEFRGGRRRTRW